MPTLESIDLWIKTNVLDSKDWDDSSKKDLAVTQAIRNLVRWYTNVEPTVEVVALQAIWELQGTNPALKLQTQGVRSVSEGEDRIDYLTRDKVAPEVREILGVPSFELEASGFVVLEGGSLL